MPIFRGPGMNRRGPGLLGTVARTAVVAGTASAVSGRVQQRQQQRWGAQEAAAQEEAAAQQQAVQQQTPPAQAAPPAPPADDIIDRLERLAELKKQGILTDAEFEAQKAKILAG
jgi:membrane protease subunit (stomatin/prohibitin family)